MDRVGASKRSFHEFLLEPCSKSRRMAPAAAVDPLSAPLEFNEPDTIRDFLREQNLPLYPDIIYLPDEDDEEEEQDTHAVLHAGRRCWEDETDFDDSLIRSNFFNTEPEVSVTQESDLCPPTSSGDRSSEYFTPTLSGSEESVWTSKLHFCCLPRAQCSSVLPGTTTTDEINADGDVSGDKAAAVPVPSTCSSIVTWEMLEGVGDKFS